ncbi:MAG: tol-pal system-associated acyl-CoA thioesterase [Parvularculales bacterium]
MSGGEEQWPDIAGQIKSRRTKEYVHMLPVRIYYEDTDFSGVVYHANYLRYAERGRSDFLRLVGRSHQQMLAEEPPLVYTVHRITMTFHQPARIDDLLEVCTQFNRITRVRLVIQQTIWRGETLIWSADITVACVDFEGRLKRLPDALYHCLSPYASTS